MSSGRRLCYKREYPTGKELSLKDRTTAPGKSKQMKSYPAAIEDC
jgi:hypothetical protein